MRGGTTSSVLAMVEGLRNAGVSVDIVASDDDGPGRRLAANAAERQLRGRHYLIKRREFYSYTPHFGPWLYEFSWKFDLIHIHGLFSHMDIVAGTLAREAALPYVVTPHGMAGAYPLSLKPLRKRLSMALFERKLLRLAAAVHLTSSGELADFKLLGIDVPARLIPLGFDPPPPGDATRFAKTYRQISGKPLIAFVGRLDPIKNLEALIDAAGLLRQSMPGLQLAIAGAGEQQYEKKLLARAEAKGAPGLVHFLGFVSGEAKADLLAAADCFVLPSHYESFGMSALGAVAASLPLVVSQNVGLANDLAKAGLAVVVEPFPADLAKGISEAINIDRKGHRISAARHVAAEFAPQTITQAVLAMYRQAIQGTLR